ncbi:zinc finger protein OZF-like [Sitodiplosis mosellana]|uniref:zinc finger protein OZF-like n=1 Tax=Sitodiplosis mosellana TaxID=263140 RepID=UPI0024446E37|nr:zinc finger protein OZF-like [Sitodiplosis mosellana]
MGTMSNSSKISDKFKDICRVCAKKSTKTISLFGIRKKGLILAEMLAICTHIRVDKQTDCRPSNICSPCLSNLEIAFDFYNLVKSSENNFQKMLATHSVNDEEKSQAIEFCTLDDNDSMVQKHLKVEFSEGNAELISNQQQRIEQKRKRRSAPNETVEPHQLDVDSQQMQQEMHNRKMNRLFECFLCKAKLKSYTDTRVHLKRHYEATPFKCKICAMNFSAVQYERHLCRGQSVQCVYCLESFETTINLMDHLECHREQHNLHKCTECSKLFPMLWLLECHQVQHRQVEKPYVCHICFRGFRINFALTKHLSTHSNERPHLCSTCGMGFKTMGTLRSHAIRHSGYKPIACSKCPKRFFSNADLRKHMDVHSDAKYVCNLCGSSLSSKRSLDEHRRHRHRKAEEQTCDLCSMKFRTIYNLKRHLLTHTGEKPHKCMYCERAFAQSGDLNKHLRQHVGDKTYQCNLCFKSFRLQIELRKHSYEHFQNENKSETHIQ